MANFVKPAEHLGLVKVTRQIVRPLLVLGSPVDVSEPGTAFGSEDILGYVQDGCCQGSHSTHIGTLEIHFKP